MSSQPHNSPAPVAQKQLELEAALRALPSPPERMAFLVRRGRERPSMREEAKTETNLVPGCLAKLWLQAEYRDAQCHFQIDSPSAVVKGIAAVICDFYSGATPVEVLQTDPSFLEELGIAQHLAPHRRNSLAGLITRLKEFARQHAVA